jgi:putative MATE family efflux protein
MKNDLTQGNVFKKLTMFAIPFLASNVIQSFYNVADMLIVGNFSGTASMSGVNIGGHVVFILTNLVIGLSVGGTVLIGQYVGSRNDDSLCKVTATMLTLLPAAGIALTILTLIFKAPLLTLIKTPPESVVETSRYLTVTTTGLVFIFGYNALSAILRGMGDSKNPFYFVMIACVINIALDLLFVAVFKWAAFGAALATVISQAISMFLCIGYMIGHQFHFDFKFSSFKIYREQLALILKIGLPSSLSNSIVSISFLFITVLVNMVGVNASAAVGAAGKFNGFSFMPVVAIGASISAMSAQNIGAGRWDRAIEACRIGTIVSLVIMTVFFFFVQIFPAEIIAIFGNDPDMIVYGVEYFRWFSFDYLVVPFVFCFGGLLTGAGHTFFTLITHMLSSVLLRVPLCWFFGVTLQWGLTGIGLGIPVASAGTVLITTGYLISGKWKKNIVRHIYYEETAVDA